MVMGQQRADPRRGGPVDTQLVLERMAIGSEARSRHAGQQYQRTRLRLRMPGGDRLDDGRVLDEDGMEPFAQQTLCQLGVAPAGPNEVGEGSEDTWELSFQQCLCGGCQTDVLAVELSERVAPCLELCQRSFGLAPGGSGSHLLFMQRPDVPACMLQCFHSPDCGLCIVIDALRCGSRVARGVLRRGVARLAFVGRQCQLLAQLAPLAVQRTALDFQRPRAVRTTLQRFLELAHREPRRGEPSPDVVLFGGSRPQLVLHGSEVTLGGSAFRSGRFMLALALRRAPLGLDALIGRGLAPLAGVTQALGSEGEVAVEPSNLELGVAEPALDFGASRLTRVPRLDARLPVMLGIFESRACRGELLGQLARTDAERAERQIEVLDLPPHQRQRDPKTLLDHLAVAFGTAALAREAADLRLHFGDQILEPREIGRRLFEPPLGALLPVTVQPDSRRFLEERPPLLGFLGQQRLDHLRFHHDGGVRAKTGAAEQILDVAEPHR